MGRLKGATILSRQASGATIKKAIRCGKARGDKSRFTRPRLLSAVVRPTKFVGLRNGGFTGLLIPD